MIEIEAMLKQYIYNQCIHKLQNAWQKKKIGKANERKGKVKRAKDEEVNGKGSMYWICKTS